MFPSPKRMFLTKGIGVHRHALTAFECAWRDADIEQQNLVYVSSILPPRCEAITRETGVELLRPGDITFCVLARSETNEFGRHVYASLGLARPADPDMYGYISELHGYGMTAEASGEQAEDLAATMQRHPHALAMFVVTEADAAAIRAVYEQRGEFAAAVELRRRLPGIADNTQARACARTIASWRPRPARCERARSIDLLQRLCFRYPSGASSSGTQRGPCSPRTSSGANSRCWSAIAFSACCTSSGVLTERSPTATISSPVTI